MQTTCYMQQVQSSVTKVPDAMSFYKKYKYVVEVDESHLNKLRSGALSKSSRAGPDQVWVWGATVPRRPDRFLFRVLEHPQDAMANLGAKLRFLIVFAFSICNPKLS